MCSLSKRLAQVLGFAVVIILDPFNSYPQHIPDIVEVVRQVTGLQLLHRLLYATTERNLDMPLLDIPLYWRPHSI